MDERIVNWIILIEISDFGRKLSYYFEIEKNESLKSGNCVGFNRMFLIPLVFDCMKLG